MNSFEGAYTSIRAKVHSDNTGVTAEIPVIITEDGPLEPLVDYLLLKAGKRSFSWMQKLIQAVGLLLDFMAANRSCFDDPEVLFQTFVDRLYTGTIGEDGLDPSGLYWLPKGKRNVRQLKNELAEFSDWMAERFGTKPLDPWRRATRYEQLLNWVAYYQKRNKCFLGHTWSRQNISEVAKHAKNTLLRQNDKVDHDGVKNFPDEWIFDLLFKGFIIPGKQKSRRIEERLNLRDILITMLMHFGGVRASEPFHLYVHDVLPDPLDSTHALVRIYHPSEGVAPPDWYDAKGKPIKCNREAYLRGKYGMRPRSQYFETDQLHAGWKGNLLDSRANFMYIHWFPSWAGKLFLVLWKKYLVQRALKQCDHPFALVTEQGKPYSLDSFEQAFERAVERIGLIPAKSLGTTPHGCRHAFGQRMTDAGIDPVYRKKAFHHKALHSQVTYTEPEAAKVTKALDKATEALNAGKSLSPPDLLQYGFEDIDPCGLLSGPNPKLKGR